MSVIYTTYNVELKQYLSQLGFKYLICGRAIKSPDKLFWVYERTPTLNLILDQWFGAKK
jgi:hypothetical protein